MSETTERPVAFHRLKRDQLLTLAIALQDQRDEALTLARKQAAALEAVKVIEQRLERSMQGEDREIAEDLRAALGDGA